MGDAGKWRRFDSDGSGKRQEPILDSTRDAVWPKARRGANGRISRDRKTVRIPRIPEEEQRNIKTYVAKMTTTDGDIGRCSRIWGGLGNLARGGGKNINVNH